MKGVLKNAGDSRARGCEGPLLGDTHPERLAGPAFFNTSMKVYQTRSEEETRELGRDWAASLKPGSILALVGELGSGKTCFVQGLARGLEIPQTVPIASPTFVLIHEYPGGKLPLFHLDFYRLEKEEEAVQLNLEEYWEGAGICVVEWADRFPKLIPSQAQWIHFKFLGESEREIRC